MEFFTYLGLFSPLASSLILLACSMSIKRPWAGFIGCTSILISFLSFFTVLVLYFNHNMSPESFVLFNWIPIKGINATFNLHIDSLALMMAMIITGVGFLIHLYSNGYMEHDENFARYFVCMNFFVFSMLLLVLAGHLLLLFVGWEGVGLASYLLIGFWYQRPSAAQAATKAFIMNRIGDFGLLFGLLLTFNLFQTGNISEISQKAPELFNIGAPSLTLITLLYFVGSIGKSAQFPLHSWLPDAMEGPTPVSALIHAATMVTAGVYLIVRLHTLFLLTPLTLLIIGFIGAMTSLYAALCAMGQTDLKKVLAYSTMSQLGLMFVACGAGAFYSAMFHLTTHAFMKSLLFLSAGNIVHVLNGETAMEKMGGLSSKLKFTNILFLVGVLAMSGIPPLSAFFSKDMILEQEYLAGSYILFYLSLGASILTGAYLIRAYCLTFKGKSHELINRLEEPRKIMLLPLAPLALLAIGGGFLGFSFGHVPLLASFLDEIGITPVERHLSEGLFLSPETVLAIGGAFFGVLASLIVYTYYPNRLGETIKCLKNAFYIDKIYEKIFILPLEKISKFIINTLEPKIFNRSLLWVGESLDALSGGVQQLQNGQIRSYMAWTGIGASAMILYFVFHHPQ